MTETPWHKYQTSETPQVPEKIVQTPPHNRSITSSFIHKFPLIPEALALLRRLGSRLESQLERYWVLEALSSLVAVLAFIALCYALHRVENDTYQPSSNKIGRATIYSIASIFGVIIKAAISLPISTGISQLKWTWYKERRKLADIERFEGASHGALGSALLIFKLHFRHLGSLGAFLTIFALPLGPIIQSSITLPSRSTNATNPLVIVPRTSIYNGTRIMTSTTDLWPRSDMIMAIKFGAAFAGNLGKHIRVHTPFEFCLTGHCEFGLYDTLGVSHRCENRSHEVILTNNGTSYTLPGTNLTILNRTPDNTTSGIISVRSTTTFQNTTLFLQLGPPIVQTTILVNNWVDAPVAMDCALTWAVHTYNGSLNTRNSPYLVETPIEKNFIWSQNGNITLQSDECWINGTIVRNDTDPTKYKGECEYTVDRDAHKALQRLLLDNQDGFFGDSISYSNVPRNFSRENDFLINVDALQEDHNKEEFMESLESTMSNIAFMMTTVVRDEETKNQSSYGWVLQDEIYYHIKWSYLAVPGILIVGGVIFVIAAAMKAHSQYPWKRSLLPLLFNGLGPQERETAGELRSVKAMKETAENFDVRFTETIHGPRLVCDSAYTPIKTT